MAEDLASGGAPTPTEVSPDAAYQQLVQDQAKVERRRNLRFGFRVAGAGLLVRRGLRSEVVSAPEIHPLSYMPTRLLGMINLHGEAVPVFDLPGFIDSTDTQAESRRFLLVLDQGAQAVATPVDVLPATLTQLEPASTEAQPPEALRPHVVGTLESGGQQWHEFDQETLFRQLADLSGGDAHGP
jgi:chemotaxis signal transduction protein